MNSKFKTSLLATFIIIGNLYVSEGQRYMQIERLPFNTDIYAEYGPMFYKNGLVFCSNRKTEVFTVTTTQDDEYLLNLYEVESRKEGRWEETKLFSKELTSKLVAGPLTFNKSGDRIYFTRTKNIIKRTETDTIEKNVFGIYIADLIDSTIWGNVRSWNYNPDSFNCGYPFLSDDGKTLFFSSNRPGGYGRYDIYTSELDEKGNWKEPVNIGDVINTAGSEVYPFYHKSGRLYFSSDGHEGKGRMDIFYSEFVSGQWKAPINIPAPINTRYNDFALIINATLDTGYFSTDRYGTDDIVKFTSGLPTFSNCQKQQKDSYCYEIYETGTLDLDTTTFRYEWDLGDGTKIRDLSAYHCFEGPGTYIIKLNVIDTLTGDIYFEEAKYRLSVERIVQPFINVVDTAVINEDIRMDGLQTNLENFEVDEYYWDFGDGERARNDIVRHSYRRPGVYTIQMGITNRQADETTLSDRECVTRDIIILRRRN